MTKLRKIKIRKEHKYEFKLIFLLYKEINFLAKLNEYASIQVNSDLFLSVCPEHVQLDSNAVDRRRSRTQNYGFIFNIGLSKVEIKSTLVSPKLVYVGMES
jgi:hypothetical protein